MPQEEAKKGYVAPENVRHEPLRIVRGSPLRQQSEAPRITQQDDDDIDD